MTDTSHDERRDFYRINDTVGLNYSLCNGQSDVPDEQSFADEIPNEFQLVTHLNNIDMESSTLLHNIQDVAPDISRYLKIINSKIESLARHIVTLGIDDDIKPTAVTLSAGGLNFISDEAVNIDDVLRLSLVLYPSCTGVITYGKVVRCDKMTGTVPLKYDVAIEYFLISEPDRDALVRHVLKLQSNYLRKKK